MGSIVRRVAMEKGVSFASMARKIGVVPTAMTAIFKKSHIDSGRLKTFGELLDYDFFVHYQTGDTHLMHVAEEAVEYKKEATPKMPVIPITVNLDGTKETLNYWIGKLKAINELAV